MAKSKAKRSRARQRSVERKKLSFRRRVFVAVVAVDLLLVAVFASLLTDALSTARRQVPTVAQVSSFAQTRVVEAARLQPFDLTIEMPVAPEASFDLPLDLPYDFSQAVSPGTFLDRPVQSVLNTTGRRRMTNVNVTFYDCANQGFCGRMYNGRRVYEGAAACSWNLVIGTRFRIVGDPTGRTYICEDRGLLTNTWVDIFFYYPADGYRWQAQVGRHGTIEIVN